MLAKETEIEIINRNGYVGYEIPELKINRQFSPKEKKTVTFGELEALSFIEGGDVILKDYLIIKNEEALKELIPNIEPEYFYTEEDIKRMLTTASIEEFLDCLDFAPAGVLETLKNMAVDLPLDNINKRDAILEKLNFNVTKAIEIKNTKFDGGEEDEKTESIGRRAATPKVSTETSTSGRRAAAPVSNYKIVSKAE